MPGVYVFVDGLVLYTHIFPQILHYAHTYITPVRFVNTYMYSYAHYRHIYIYNRDSDDSAEMQQPAHICLIQGLCK